MITPKIKIEAKIFGLDFVGEVSNDTLTASYNQGFNISFYDIPLLGTICKRNDGINLKNINLSYSEQESFKFDLDFDISLFGNKLISSNDLKNDSIDSDIIKYQINKSSSGFSLQSISFSFKNGIFNISINASLKLSIMELSFYELNASYDSGSFQIGLKGMNIGLTTSAITASGGLYIDNGIYNGEVFINIGKLTIAGIGSYATINNEPSFFIYAYVGYPLGGPGCFFVTGLSFGFGINRKVNLPNVEDISSFPFVKIVTKNSPSPTTATNALSDLSKWISPSKGNYFAVCGVKFTTYSLIDSLALVLVEFGTKTKINLLGQSEFKMPIASTNPILFVKLLYKASFDVDSGYLEVRAAIDKSSYFLSKDCHISGQMFFNTYFKGQNEGDFFFTIGGVHHPLFKNKNKYPTIDKIKINWQVTKNLKLSGNGYFAITPSCAMGGVFVDLSYSITCFSAWFRAQADFFLQYKPLHYDVKVSVSVGLRFSIKLIFFWLHLNLEVGAKLHLYGPEFGGHAAINFDIYTKHIDFGAKPNVKYLTFNEFKDSFLPKEIQAGTAQNYANNLRTIKIEPTLGIIKTTKTKLYLNSEDFSFEITSLIPITKLQFMSTTLEGKSFGIVPINSNNVLNEVIIELDCKDSLVYEITPIYKNYSSALYGKEFNPNSSLMKDMLSGVSISFRVKPTNYKVYSFSNLVRSNSYSFNYTRHSILKRSNKTFFGLYDSFNRELELEEVRIMNAQTSLLQYKKLFSDLNIMRDIKLNNKKISDSIKNNFFKNNFFDIHVNVTYCLGISQIKKYLFASPNVVDIERN